MLPMAYKSVWLCSRCNGKVDWSKLDCGCGYSYRDEAHLWLCTRCNEPNPWDSENCYYCRGSKPSPSPEEMKEQEKRNLSA